MADWSPISWQTYAYHQSVEYPDKSELTDVLAQLNQMPPLVTHREIHKLKKAIAKAGRGDAFILQGGDCAESFKECHQDQISSKLKILLQMSIVLSCALKKPIVRVGRIAGQYTKPRSSDIETQNGITLPSYRGDLINSPAFTLQDRIPNPNLLLQGYNCSAVTLNYIRALLNGGFSDLASIQEWDLPAISHSKQEQAYQSVVKAIQDALAIIHSFEPNIHHPLNLSEFFTSHEALHLHYEQALTRQLQDKRWYNLSTHMPWIGMRTATVYGAHVECLRGIENPIGIKIGKDATPNWLLDMLERLNPSREEGKILLISRMGTAHIADVLPALIQSVKANQIPVTWSCDPMHGNTELTNHGLKTRHFDNILEELKLALSIHHDLDSCLGGVHFELTGDHVTECIGGARGLTADDLQHAYQSLVDPRLNYEQSLEMAFELSQQYKKLQKNELDTIISV